MEIKKSEFTKLYSEGKSVKDMATILGVTETNIRFAAKQWGFNLRKKPIKGVTLVDDTIESSNNTSTNTNAESYVNHPSSVTVGEEA